MASKRTVLSRPRTKLYDANYNIGESYYRPALDRLDRKYSGRPLSPTRHQSPLAESVAERHARVFAEEDLEFSRRRAEKHITQDNLFDSRGARLSRAGAALENWNGEINDETANSIRRIRANKKVSIIEDPDLETTTNNIKTFRMLDRSDKLLDSVGINDTITRQLVDKETTQRRSALKTSYKPDEDRLTKWTPLEGARGAGSARARRLEIAESMETETGAAARRARVTKDRLNDLEEEMAAMQEKQAAREARVARLRKLVAETEQDSADFEVAQTRAERIEARRAERSAAVEY
ncbi:unnamed protein product [Phyllotreta striolata]|uniref:Uncharacterized protein n=1 Tax=Phyllotreta striolata TaxID=444603 RepID=A0A9N9TWN2_PHYSR|nr:unnamed protein product [Phyllotreta striolata]